MTADLSAALDRIEGLAAAATPGAWHVGWGENRSWVAFVDADAERANEEFVVTSDVTIGSLDYCGPDAEFIAAARTDLPKLAAVVRAVLGVHVKHRDTHGDRKVRLNGPWFCCAAVQLGVRDMDDCQACGEPWPCATVRAATKAWEDGR